VTFQVNGKGRLLNVGKLLGKLVAATSSEALKWLKSKPKDWPKSKPKCGTVQIIVGNDDLIDWLDQAQRIEKALVSSEGQDSAHKEKVRAEAENGLLRLKPFAGIVTGIFDFDATDSEELLDTLEPTFPEAGVFLKISRCTLVSVSRSDRALEAIKESIGISPYLLIPHAVLLHNEFLIAEADLNLDGDDPKKRSVEAYLKAIQREGPPIRGFWRWLFFLFRSFFKSCFSHLFGRGGQGKDELLRLAVGRLAKADKHMKSDYLPNVFNYVTERTLYERGTVIRGVTDMRTLVAGKLEDFREQIGEVQKERQEFRQNLIASILAITLIGQLNGVFVGAPETLWHKLGLAVAMVVFWILLMWLRAPGGTGPEEPEAEIEHEHKHVT